MAYTRTIGNTLAWARHFIGHRPTILALDLEPALTSANIVQQTVMQPPFKWKWNRTSISFLTSIGAPYTVSIPDFGFIEKATVMDSKGNINEIPNITLNLSLDAGSGRPHTIAPIIDDGTGNITFAFMPGTPDQVYTVTIIYQKKPVLISSAALGINTIWQIPDEYGMIYDWGMLVFLYMFASDARMGIANQKFMSGLLSLSEGLDEQAKAIFLGEWEFVMKMAERTQLQTQQGIQSRV